jgi:hypothetical protein
MSCRQVRLGDDVLVEEIFRGVDTDEPLTPDVKDPSGNTLLIAAARHGHIKVRKKKKKDPLSPFHPLRPFSSFCVCAGRRLVTA